MLPDAQVFFSHAGRQSAWRYDFRPILENADLYIGGATVVPVRYRIHHRFAQSVFRQFQTFLASLRGRNERRIEFSHQKAHGVFID